MKNKKFDNLEAFKLTNFSLHSVIGGDAHTCTSGNTTCSGPNGDIDSKNVDSQWETIGNTGSLGQPFGSSSN